MLPPYIDNTTSNDTNLTSRKITSTSSCSIFKFIWWNESWEYRIPYYLPPSVKECQYPLISFEINFSDILSKIGASVELDINSLRLIAYDNDSADMIIYNPARIGNEKYCIPIQFNTTLDYQLNPLEEVTINAVCNWSIPPNKATFFYLYFDILANGPKSTIDYMVGQWWTDVSRVGNESFILSNDLVELYRERDTSKILYCGENPSKSYIKDKETSLKLITGFYNELRITNKEGNFSYYMQENKFTADILSVYKGPVYAEVEIRINSHNLSYNNDVYLYYRIFREKRLVECNLWLKKQIGYTLDNSWNGRYIFWPLDSYDLMYTDSRGYRPIITEWDTNVQYLIAYNSINNNSACFWTKNKGNVRVEPPPSYNAYDSYGFSADNFHYRYFYAVGNVNSTQQEMEMLCSLEKMESFDFQSRLGIVCPEFNKIFFDGNALSINIVTFSEKEGGVNDVLCTLYNPFGTPMIINLYTSDYIEWKNDNVLFFDLSYPEGEWSINITILRNGLNPYNISKIFHLKHPFKPSLFFNAEDFIKLRQIAYGPMKATWYELLLQTLELVKRTPKKELDINDDTTNYQNIIEKLAFAYIITENPIFLRSAELWMVSIANYSSWAIWKQAPDLQRNHLAMGLMMGLDMLFYDIAEENRTFILNRLILEGKNLYQIIENTKELHIDSYDNNHCWITMATLATLAYGLDQIIDTSAWKSELKFRIQKIYSNFYEDGSSHEGINYWNYGFPYVIYFTELVRRFDNENYFNQSYFINALKFRVYYMLPDRAESLLLGDSNYYLNHNTWVTMLLANIFNDPYAQWVSFNSNKYINTPLSFNKAGNGTGEFFRSKSYSHSGEYSFYVVDNETTHYTYAQSYRFPVNYTKKFTVSGWVRSDQPTDYSVPIVFQDSNGYDVYPVIYESTIPASTSWTRFEFNITGQEAFPSIVYARIYLRPYKTVSDIGRVYFDDLSMCEYTSIENLIPNPSAEEMYASVHPWNIVFYNYSVIQKHPEEGLPLYNYFNNHGVFVQRNNWSDDALHFMFKCGPIRGGHEHPDTNSFLLTYGSRNLIIDDGYTWKKETQTHNTILFDNQGQIGEGGTYTGVPEEDQWGFISNLLMNDEFAMMVGNGAPAYDESIGLQKWDRTIYAFAGGYYFIHDSIRLDSPTNITWLLHHSASEIIDTNRIKFIYGDKNMTLFRSINFSSNAQIYLEDSFYVPQLKPNGDFNDNLEYFPLGRQYRINPTINFDSYELLHLIVPNSQDPLTYNALDTEVNYTGMHITYQDEEVWIACANELKPQQLYTLYHDGSGVIRRNINSSATVYYVMMDGTYLKEGDNSIISLSTRGGAMVKYCAHENLSATVQSNSDVIASLNITRPYGSLRPEKISVKLDGAFINSSFYEYNIETGIVQLMLSPGVHQIFISRDIQPPNLNIRFGEMSFSNNSYINKKNITISFLTIDEGIGVSNTTIRVDSLFNDIIGGEGIHSIVISNLSEGVHIIEIESIDFYENSIIQSIYITIDLTPPEILITDNTATEGIKNKYLVFYLQASDTLSGLQTFTVEIIDNKGTIVWKNDTKILPEGLKTYLEIMKIDINEYNLTYGVYNLRLNVTDRASNMEIQEFLIVIRNDNVNKEQYFLIFLLIVLGISVAIVSILILNKTKSRFQTNKIKNMQLEDLNMKEKKLEKIKSDIKDIKSQKEKKEIVLEKIKNLDSEINKLEKDIKKLDLKFSLRKRKSKKI